jgi:coenzyme F420-reducing hydrogenase delta subunit/Pyruvate/2-oxoacid:ferredoxin oxidoreductase delta subunit
MVTESLLRVALLLKQQRGCLCIVIFRDLGVAAAGLEELYKDARGAGVLFIRLGADEPTVSQTENGKWQVGVNVAGLGTITDVADVLIHCDTPPPADLDGLRHALGVALGSGQSADADRMHLEPVFTERAGVFWVGSSRSPGTSGQAGRLGEAAAMAAALVASAGPGAVEAPAIVDTARCALCLTCFRVCPHQAMVIDTGPAMRVLTSACQGCGICASACPAGAIQVVNADGRRILAEIDALLDDPMPGQRPVVVFACANSAVPAAQALGRLRRSYPSRVLLVQVPCLGRIESIHCLRPLAAGAEQVLLCGCFDKSCEHLNGPSRARVVVDRASALIEAVGLNSKAVQVASMAPVDWHRLARLLDAVGDRPPSAHTPDQTETPIGAAHGAP